MRIEPGAVHYSVVPPSAVGGVTPGIGDGSPALGLRYEGIGRFGAVTMLLGLGGARPVADYETETARGQSISR